MGIDEEQDFTVDVSSHKNTFEEIVFLGKVILSNNLDFNA